MLKRFLLLVLFAGLAQARITTRFQEALYFRYEKGTGHHSTFDLMGSEVNVETNLSNTNRDLLTLALQVYVWGSMEGWAKAMHYGNAYAIFPLGIGKPNLKIGQQVVPFGLLADYDTHGQIFQTTYALALGERIDAGVSAFGILGPLDWWYMVSNGRGPNVMDQDENKVQTARLAIGLENATADMRFGLSLLRGVLPNFSEDPLKDMMAEPDTFLLKNRIGFDFDLAPTFLTVRAELIGGNQGQITRIDDVTKHGVLSGYLELRLPVRYGLEAMAQYSFFQPTLDRLDMSSDLAAGISLAPATIKNLNLQVAGIKRDDNHRISYHVIGQVGINL